MQNIPDYSKSKQ